MRKFTFYLLMISMIAANTPAVGQNNFTANLLFSASLDGAQETPAVATSAIGVASFALNATHDTMCINVTVQGLSGPITAAHIHEAPPGVPGGVVISLVPGIVGNRIVATLTAPTLTSAVIAKFLEGMYYINIHTAANSNGEIRGQITLETELQFTASLNGAQETPAISTSAYGLGVFLLYQNLKELIVNVKVAGLSGPIIGAHLHSGAPGVPGGVVQDLQTGLAGNSISISVDPTLYLTDLLTGNIYVNIHTTANPNGEIRGQLIMDNKMSFGMLLDGNQETPAVPVPATGVGYMKVNGAMDTVWYDVVCDGLSSSPPTLAHFHAGARGVPGPVVVSLVSGINGSRISGFATGAGVDKDFINNCLTGNVYVNVHTTANAGGEIRGQVDRYAREGLTYTIDAMQEVPLTTSTAIGSGLASIDLHESALHFMIVVNDLTGIASMAHFHNAPAGTPGPVAFTLTNFFALTDSNDYASGWWADDDATPLTDVEVGKFLANEMYFNIHTLAYPAGEIRGNILLGGECFQTITGIGKEASVRNDLIIYPNPFNGRVSVSFEGNASADGRLMVLDMMGSSMLTENISIVKGENKHDLNLDRLSSGIYFISLERNNVKSFVGKVVKD